MAATYDFDEEDGPSNFFNTRLQPFPDLVEGKIKASHFIRSAKALIAVAVEIKDLEALRNDMNLNMERLSNMQGSECLQELILDDTAADGRNFRRAESLLWIKRAMRLVYLFLRAINDDFYEGNSTEDLGPFMRAAYQATLMTYHDRDIKRKFEGLYTRFPSRSTIIALLLLLHDTTWESLMDDMKEFLKNMQLNLDTLDQFFADHDLEDIIAERLRQQLERDQAHNMACD